MERPRGNGKRYFFTTRWRSVVILLAVAFAMPYVVFAAWEAIRHAQTDVLRWVDDSLPSAKTFSEFRNRFGSQEFFMISWPECSPDTGQLSALADQIRASAEAKLFQSLTTSSEMVARLQSQPGIHASSVPRRLRGVFLGPDGSRTALIAQLSAAGSQERPAAIRAVQEAAKEVGLDPESLRIGGAGSDLAWLDREGVAAPLRVVGFSWLAVIAIACVSLRSARLGIMVSGLGILVALLSVALIHVSGARVNAVTSTLPTLGLLMTASLCLHWLGYYGRACADTASCDAIGTAWSMAAWPTILSALTTSLGLLSLVFSRTSAIPEFGQFGAATTVASAVFALFVLPAILRVSGIRYQLNRRTQQDRWHRFISWTRKRAAVILPASVLGVTAAALGLLQLQTGVRLNDFFSEEHEAVAETRWLESNLGPLASLELVLALPASSSRGEENKGERTLQALRLLERLEETLKRSDDDAVVFSALDLVPPLPRPGGFRGVVAERLYILGLEKEKELSETNLAARETSGDYWRVMVRVSNLASESGRSFVARAEELEQTARQILESESAKPASHQASVHVTGIPIVLEQIEQQFLEDLVVTYAAAVGMVFLCVLVGLRNARLSAVAMLPNTFPPIIVLGIVGWAGLRLEVGSVMTAAIALGVAVDDTMHLLFWINRKARAGDPMKQVLPDAFAHCGSVVLLTSILGGCGLAVLGFSSFLPTARFGLLIASMLAAAVLADLVFLPALLSTRLGPWTVRQSSQ